MGKSLEVSIPKGFRGRSRRYGSHIIDCLPSCLGDKQAPVHSPILTHVLEVLCQSQPCSTVSVNSMCTALRWGHRSAVTYVMLGVYLEYLIGIWTGSGTFFKCTREVCMSGLKERI